MRWFRNRTTGHVEAWDTDDPDKIGEMITPQGPTHLFAYEEVTDDIGGGGGGGSTPVITREQIQGNTVNIANGGTAPLPWNIVSSGDPLLDLTTPTAPSVVDAGVYAVSVQINAEDVMTADGVFSASLALDNSGDFAGMSGVSNAAYAGFTKPYLALSLTYYIPAGGTIVVTVGNFDGANAIHFDLFGIVQRLS